MESIKLTINYKSGAKVENIVNYVHFENGKIIFTVKNQMHSAVQLPVNVPLENVESFDIEESEQLFN